MKNLLSNLVIVTLTCITIWQNQQLLQIEHVPSPTKQEIKKSPKSELEQVIEVYTLRNKELNRLINKLEAKLPRKYSGRVGPGY